MGYRYQSDPRRLSEESYALNQINNDPYLRSQESSAAANERANSQLIEGNQRANDTRLKGSEALWGGIKEGAIGGVKAYQQAKQQGIENKRQDMLTEEQMASSRQSRDMNQAQMDYDSKFKDKVGQQGLDLGQSNIALNNANTKTAINQAEESSAATTFKNAINQKTGKTNRETGFQSEMDSVQTELAVKQGDLKLRQQELEHNEELAPLQRQALVAQNNASQAQTAAAWTQNTLNNLQITEKQRDETIANLSAQLENPRKGQSAEQIFQAFEANGATPSQIATAVGRLKDKEKAAKMLESINPNSPVAYAAKKTFEGREMAEKYQIALNTIDVSLKNYENGNVVTGGAKLDDAVKTISNIAKTAGFESQADDIKNFTDIKSLGVGRTERLRDIRNQFAQSAATNLSIYNAYSPEFKDRINAMVGTVYGGGNQKANPFGTSQPPMSGPQSTQPPPMQYTNFGGQSQNPGNQTTAPPAPAPMAAPLGKGWRKVGGGNPKIIGSR